MFDLRYHVTSLAAVFIALLIGILVGVALASHGLGNSERKSLEDDIRRAQNRIDRLQATVDSQRQENRSDSKFVDNTYSALMTDRLKGKRVAVLYLGSVDHPIQSDLSTAIRDAGGQAATRMYAVQVPIDAAAIEKRLGNRPALAQYAGSDRLRKLGQQLGREFVSGGETPIWNALHNMIVQEATPRFGTSKRPADAVVVVRSAESPRWASSTRTATSRPSPSSSRHSCRPSTTSISTPASSRSRSSSVSRRRVPTTA